MIDELRPRNPVPPVSPACRTAVLAEMGIAVPQRRVTDLSKPRVCLVKAWATGWRNGAFFSTLGGPS